jgi:hypothetical protein
MAADTKPGYSYAISEEYKRIKPGFKRIAKT